MAAQKPSKILSHLYLGGKPEAKAKQTLQELNITYILNCTPSRNVDREAGFSLLFVCNDLFLFYSHNLLVYLHVVSLSLCCLILLCFILSSALYLYLFVIIIFIIEMS